MTPGCFIQESIACIKRKFNCEINCAVNKTASEAVLLVISQCSFVTVVTLASVVTYVQTKHIA